MAMEEYKFPDEAESTPPEKEEKVEYEIVDDTPEADRGRKPMDAAPKEFAEDELDKYDESVKKRIKHFTKGYHEERRRAESAEREREEAVRIAQTVVEENKKLQGSLSTNQAALLEQAKKTVTSEVEQARAKYKAAYEAGDADALTAANEELMAVKTKFERVHNYKPAPLQPPPNVVQTQPKSIETPAPDPKAEAWRDKNSSWWGTDDEMTSFALGLHTKLVKSGVDPRSDDYYEKLNSRLQQVFPDAFESEKQVDAPTPHRKSNVAPATRSTAPKKIVLTTSQVTIAKRLGVPLDLYARKVAEEMRKT